MHIDLDGFKGLCVTQNNEKFLEGNEVSAI